ncbi:homoserine acetyltransferase family protein [Geopyxis carbonaria]|nr:homoserine acetyltransferase family protein [Geopyxis carbonaria]
MTAPTPQTHALGNLPLISGHVLHNAHISYTIRGAPSLPVILYPTFFTARLHNTHYLHAAFPPDRYRLLTVSLFGSGESSSPSNHPSHAETPFPSISLADNVAAQKALLDALKIERLHAVVGWSMGGMTALAWAAQYPHVLQGGAGVVALCATAKCSDHNAVFLEGVKAALGAAEPLKAMARVYAGWGFSAAFYQERGWAALGYGSLEAFLVEFWEGWTGEGCVPDLLAQIETWQKADAGVAAIAHSKVRVLMLPGDGDMYFSAVDAERECKEIEAAGGSAMCERIPGVCGHWAAGPGGKKEELEWVVARVRRFLDGDKKEGGVEEVRKTLGGVELGREEVVETDGVGAPLAS